MTFGRTIDGAGFGGLGGLLGWLLFGTFGDRNPSAQATFGFLSGEDLNLALGGACLGGAIGLLAASVDAIRDLAPTRFARAASWGTSLGALGGALGMWLGDHANGWLQAVLGGGLGTAISARALGWSLLGLAIGASDGVAARSPGRAGLGAVGGLLGGAVGGALFELFYAFARASLATTYFWNALGLVVLGACVGALATLVRTAFRPASLRVLNGWQEGREFSLDLTQTRIGRAEQADVALFRDQTIEKRHALVRREKDRYVLVNDGATPERLRVNDQPVPSERALVDGDAILVGSVRLRFRLRGRRHG